MWKLYDRGDGGGGGGGGAGAPDLPLENYKMSFISIRASPEKQPPSPPPPLELSGSARACLTVDFYFYLPFLHVTGLAIILPSADAQADLRLCCLHATKSSFSQQGTRNGVNKANPDRMS